MLVPVAGRGAVTLDEQRHIPLGDLPPIFIHDSSFVARHDLPGASRLDLIGPVGNENVNELRGADAVGNLDPMPLHPALEDIGRKRLTGGNT